jgi:translation initiation factor 2B subunit (eIF-2B alpha/beta/delta family)
MQTIEERIEAVRNDREHGSRWLVRETLLILRDLASRSDVPRDELMRQLYATGQILAQLRPSMAAIAGAVGRILNVQGGPSAIADEATGLLKDYDTATQRIAVHARPFIHGRVMTCSISGTVLDVLLANRGAIEEVTVLEGRPRYEGRDMARVLSGQGMAVTLITDAQADIFLAQSDCVMVGADSVLANGDILNKAGTALLGWAARGHEIVFNVLCETLKISPHDWGQETGQSATGQLAMLEEKEPQEVLSQPMPGVAVRNYYFDHTPYMLISHLITEHGVLGKPEIWALAERARENEHNLFRGYI